MRAASLMHVGFLLMLCAAARSVEVTAATEPATGALTNRAKFTNQLVRKEAGHVESADQPRSACGSAPSFTVGTWNHVVHERTSLVSGPVLADFRDEYSMAELPARLGSGLNVDDIISVDCPRDGHCGPPLTAPCPQGHCGRRRIDTEKHIPEIVGNLVLESPGVQ